MEFPSAWLSSAILIHSVLGAYVHCLLLIPGRLPTPLSHFYNESLSAHYGVSLDEPGFIRVNSLISNLGIAGQILSTLFLLPQMDRWGRKNVAVYVSGAIASASSVLVILSKTAQSVELFAVSQFLAGTLLSIKAGVIKIYLSECSPDAIRGFTAQAITALSAFTGQAIMFLTLEELLGTDDRWVYMGVVSLVFTLIFVFSAAFIPESPKYLCSENVDEKVVVKTIQKFHGKDVDISHVLTSFRREIQLTNTSHTSLRQLWGDEGLRDSLLLVVLAALVHSVSANQILSLNNVPLKIRYGFTNSAALLIDTVIGVVTTPFMFVLPYLLEKVGRRKLFLTSMSLSVLSLILMGLTQLIWRAAGPGTLTMFLALVFTVTNLVAMSTGEGTMGIILIVDLLPVSAKAVATQCLLLSMSFSAMAVNFVYSSLEPLSGGFTYVPFILCQSFFLYYCFHHLPETRGRAVYQNYEVLKSRGTSRRHSLLPRGRSRTATATYGT